MSAERIHNPDYATSSVRREDIPADNGCGAGLFAAPAPCSTTHILLLICP
jgi:hypothetical protein